MEYQTTIKKKEILPFVTTCMDLQGIRLSEMSQRRQIVYDLTYMLNLKKQTHRNRQKMGSCQRQSKGVGKSEQSGSKGTNFQL